MILKSFSLFIHILRTTQIYSDWLVIFFYQKLTMTYKLLCFSQIKKVNFAFLACQYFAFRCIDFCYQQGGVIYFELRLAVLCAYAFKRICLQNVENPSVRNFEFSSNSQERYILLVFISALTFLFFCFILMYTLTYLNI